MDFTDKGSFERLFKSSYGRFCDYAMRFVDDAQIAENIVQDFFVAIWEKNNLTITEENFQFYAFRAIKNACLNYHKSLNVREEAFSHIIKEYEHEKEINLDSDFLYKKEVQQALKKLPEKCREVFLLRVLMEMTYDEVSKECGISINTVKYHLKESFKIMREELKKMSFLFIFINFTYPF